MSHVTCHDVSLADECLMAIAFILGFTFQVHVHIYGSCSQFVIQLDVA